MNEKKIIDIKSIFKNKNLDSKEIKLKAEKLMKKKYNCYEIFTR